MDYKVLFCFSKSKDPVMYFHAEVFSFKIEIKRFSPSNILGKLIIKLNQNFVQFFTKCYQHLLVKEEIFYKGPFEQNSWIF